jgi:hypothetical protein
MDNNIDYSSFGDWSISKEMFDWISNNIPDGSTIVELGSGRGTKELVKKYVVYSIEHDIEWVGFEEKSNYIYAPLVDGWYDVSIVKNELPEKYDLLIVDGPIREDRINFIKNYGIFNTNIPIIIDDTNRIEDKEMSILLSDKLQREPIEIGNDEKSFIILL